MKITKEMVFESVRMKRNWCSPGDVKITNYWIKRVNVFHQEITTALNVIIENRLELSTMLFSLPLGAFPLRFVCVPFFNMHKGGVHDITHCYNPGKKCVLPY